MTTPLFHIFHTRIEKIRSLVRARGVDGFLLINHEYSGQPGTRYLSGFSGSESILLITHQKNYILADGRYTTQAREEAPDCELVPRERFAYTEDMRKLCDAHHIRSLVVDSRRTYHGHVEKLNAELPNVSIVGEDNMLQTIRIVKDADEITHLRKAALIACTAFNELLGYIQEGRTEKELAWKLETLMRERGAEKISFDPIVASGENGAKPHAKPTEKMVKRGELVIFDFGCFVNGYASDMTRTIAVGAPPEKLAKMYEAVREAQSLGLKAARAGITGEELDAACRRHIAERGYEKYFSHGTGHGIGMEVHELPYVSVHNRDALPEHCAITVEPGIYIEGVGGVRIEDTVILTKEGNVNLCKGVSKELVVI